jgi:isoleucyl-tRNA synthetase
MTDRRGVWHTPSNAGETLSIHCADMPTVVESLIDGDLERRMELAQKIVSLTRFLREKSKLRIRQPLRRILVPINNPTERRDIQAVSAIIREELNIKEIEFITDDSAIIQKAAKGNFKTLGRKFGKQTQMVADAIRSFTNSQIRELERIRSIVITVGGSYFVVDLEDVEISSNDLEGWLVAVDSGVTVALDTTVDADLLQEGIAREFVSRVQNLRKDAGFAVTDRIRIEVVCGDEIRLAIESKREYITVETLCDAISFVEELPLDCGMEFLDERVFLGVVRV